MKTSFPLFLLLGFAVNSTALAQEPLIILEGEARNNALGWHDIDFAGDVNGDGYDDIVTGALDWTDFYKIFFQIHSGFDGRILHSWRFGVDGDAAAARSCSRGGDVDGDGLADVVLGGSTGIDGINGGENFVEVRSGGTGGVIHRWAKPWPMVLGRTVAGGGDANGDGVPDILYWELSSRSDDSWVRVRSGATGRLLYTVSRWVDPNARSWYFGWSLDFCGDVNGDGCEDFLVGDPDSSAGGSRAGAAFVFSGKDGVELFRFTGPVSQSDFGASVAGPGDMNGDGVPDFAVGAPFFIGATRYSGLWEAYSGSDGSLLFHMEGDANGGGVGQHLARIGDVNHDGFADVVVQGGSDAYENRLARVFSGSDFSVLSTVRGGGWQKYGYAIAGGGDLNADGFPDFAVSAPEYKVHTGRIYVYPGGPVLDVPPLIAGRHADIGARHFVKDLHTALAVSLVGPGVTPLPRFEINLDLLDPIAVGPILRADSQGQRSWHLLVPPGTTGTPVWLQAAQYRHKTNVVQRLIQ